MTVIMDYLYTLACNDIRKTQSDIQQNNARHKASCSFCEVTLEADLIRTILMPFLPLFDSEEVENE
ncbi:hypothetical protein Ocin01_10546 [Orchesella cincta]|uniref:Uncharacterized protein n=1 Tax=Orchesella cincta TaxID=48709 RepID=A0A1D2MTL4_ORCCI|nr:hypothetical protein Ocin01_10546 [Orchesella cincta]